MTATAEERRRKGKSESADSRLWCRGTGRETCRSGGGGGGGRLSRRASERAILAKEATAGAWPLEQTQKLRHRLTGAKAKGRKEDSEKELPSYNAAAAAASHRAASRTILGVGSGGGGITLLSGREGTLSLSEVP